MRREVEILLFATLVLGHFWVPAQQEVQVVTKTIEKSYVPKPGHVIKVFGESATINVIGTKSNQVKVVLRLISKAYTKPTAEKELEYQKFIIDETRGAHVIKNYLLLPKGFQELSSVQECEIDIWIPKDQHLAIENSFGRIVVKDLTGQLSITNKYGDVQLDELDGTAVVVSNFGDLNVTSFSGNLTLDLTSVETQINGMSGNAKIKTNLGDIEIRGLKIDQYAKVSGIKSSVVLSVPSLDDFFWSIKTTYGHLQGPPELMRKVTSLKNIKVEYGKEDFPLVSIETDFGEIEVLTKE